jgi:hypothetical protein
MRRTVTAALAAAALGFAVASWQALPVARAEKQGGPAAARPRWEYRVVYESDLLAPDPRDRRGPDGYRDWVADGLNRLGEEGWELTAAVPSYAPGPATRFYFKRPK